MSLPEVAEAAAGADGAPWCDRSQTSYQADAASSCRRHQYVVAGRCGRILVWRGGWLARARGDAGGLGVDGSRLCVPPRSLLRGAITAVTAVGVLAVGWVAGGQSSQRAYDECMARGEEVRSALAEFRAHAGGYPRSLDEIPRRLPCRRVLRGSLLKYELTGSGYALSFGDWLVSHSATESEGFMAHK